jgi:uncharacterized Zn finger protein
MAWYGYGDWDYRPYVSVATRKARAAAALAKLTKKSGRAPEPILFKNRRRQIATTFWGNAWCENLERYADFANRLPRGRTYVRNGSVVDLTIGEGKVEARVAGSELYEVTISIAALAEPRWRRVVTRCTGKIGSLVGLLRGELSADVIAVLVGAKEGLFPEPRAMTFECSCPDWADMCKHVAAVLYGVGIRLDEKPALFFTLRQVDQTELLSSATSGAVSRTRSGAGKRIAADKLADVFGIEIEGEPSGTGKKANGKVSRAAVRGIRRGSHPRPLDASTPVIAVGGPSRRRDRHR